MEIILTPETVAELYTDGSLGVLRYWRLVGEGPPFIQLSARRVGYRQSDCEAWAASRTFVNRAEAVAVVPLSRRPKPVAATRPAEPKVDQKRARRAAAAAA